MLRPELVEKIKIIVASKNEVEEKLGNPEILANPKLYNECAKEYSRIRELGALFDTYTVSNEELVENNLMLEQEEDEEFLELLRSDIENLTAKVEAAEKKLKVLLVPNEPDDSRNTIIEIRAGTGGDEAALFAAEIYRMYARYAEKVGWKIETLDTNETGIGGIKEITFLITGDMVYRKLKYESGAHRVQRVPETEASGRIHTSAVTVAVLPEAEDIEVHIDPNEIRVDTYRASGNGGQSVNTMDSAVRITHIPTGVVVQCQDEKSQVKNKAKALKVLKARILEAEKDKQHQKMASDRKSQIGSGDRSEKIRTYNFPQNRVTDHRIGLTLYNLENIMSGEVDDIFDALINYESELKIKNILEKN